MMQPAISAAPDPCARRFPCVADDLSLPQRQPAASVLLSQDAHLAKLIVFVVRQSGEMIAADLRGGRRNWRSAVTTVSGLHL
jgi:hypothetical protein